MKTQRAGFGLIEILVVVVVIALLVGGGWYTRRMRETKTTVETGLDAEKKAEEAKQAIEQQNQKVQDAVNGAAVKKQPVASPSSQSAPVRVISPNGGETWLRGKQYNVKWNTTLASGAKVFIILVKTATIIRDPYTVAPDKFISFEMFPQSLFPQGLPKEGTFTYSVPNSLPAGSYQLLVWSGEVCSIAVKKPKCVFDLSDSIFTIK